MGDGNAEGRRRPTFYCSFCGKKQDEVAKLIAGPKVFICDECVDLCNDICAGRLDAQKRLSLVEQERDAGAVKALTGTSIAYRPDEDLTVEIRALADTAPVLSPGYVLLSRHDWDRLAISILRLKHFDASGSA